MGGLRGEGSGSGLLALDPGLFTTVQDLGRVGYRMWGVPVGGAFDVRSHGLANALVGNGPEAATLELTLRGGVYEAVGGPLALGLAGADMGAIRQREGGSVVELRAVGSFTLEPGERVVLGGAKRGARAYLAVRGGWRTALVMGSRSTEVSIERGMVLPAEPGRVAVRFPAGWKGVEEGAIMLRVVDGPDAGRFGRMDWGPLLYRVGSRSGRMGVRLEGPALAEEEEEAERLSTPVVAGAVQVAGGQPIVLGPAGGTMGGYPVVACVVSGDLWRLGQARPGQVVRFERIGVEEARERGGWERAGFDRWLGRVRTVGRGDGREGRVGLSREGRGRGDSRSDQVL